MHFPTSLPGGSPRPEKENGNRETLDIELPVPVGHTPPTSLNLAVLNDSVVL